MTDEKFTLVETNRERANIARSARYTNRKGKGSVKIGVEYRTEKELQALNGEVKSYDLSKPMSFQEFKMMPEDLQGEYFRALYEKHGATQTAISNFWKIGNRTISLLRSRYNVSTNINTKRSYEINAWRKEAWNDFINKASDTEDTNDGIPCSEQVEEKPLEVKAAVETVQEQVSEEVIKMPEPAKEPSNGRMLKGSFTITGTARDIYRMLEAMIGDEERTMNISIESESFPDCLSTPIDPKTYGKVIDTMNNAQKQVMYGLIGKALDEGMAKGGKHA